MPKENPIFGVIRLVKYVLGVDNPRVEELADGAKIVVVLPNIYAHEIVELAHQLRRRFNIPTNKIVIYPKDMSRLELVIYLPW